MFNPFIDSKTGLGKTRYSIAWVLLLSLPAVWVFAAPPRRGQPDRNRALPPNWSQDVLDTFFDDARSTLAGERPNYGKRLLAGSGNPSSPGGLPNGDSSIVKPGTFQWSSLISSDTLETEIKRQKDKLAEHVKTPSRFKGGGYRKCRTIFSSLALLFAVTAEHDSDVRWKETAASLRDLFARAGRNCKVGTDGSFNEAKLRFQDLEELIRGGKIDGPKPDEDIVWSELVDRAPLMKQMEKSYEEKLEPWLSDAGTFKKNADAIQHESELLAMWAEVILKKNFKAWDEKEYIGFAKDMRDGAKAVSEAVQLKNYDLAEEASGKVYQSCTDCHEGYRS